MTEEEWDELDSLRKAISFNPATVHPAHQERFTELFVQTLAGKGDYSEPVVKAATRRTQPSYPCYNKIMNRITRFVLFQPGTRLHLEFDTYQEAWEQAEKMFRDGEGVVCIEPITKCL